MATFPNYAYPLVEGLSTQRASAVQRTDMESGPPKQLKARSRVMLTRRINYRLPTNQDYLDFINWFQTDINYGADWFDWTDPIDGVEKQGRIVQIEAEEPQDAGPSFWKVRLAIETWSG